MLLDCEQCRSCIVVRLGPRVFEFVPLCRKLLDLSAIIEAKIRKLLLRSDKPLLGLREACPKRLGFILAGRHEFVELRSGGLRLLQSIL